MACENGYVTVVKHLIKAEVDIKWSKTSLMVACEKKHWSVVKEVRKAITDAIKSSSCKKTP